MPWCSRCVADSTVGRLDAGRVAATKISTALDTLAGTDEALAASPAIPAATEGRTQLPCSPNGIGRPCRPISRKYVTSAGVTQTIVSGHTPACPLRMHLPGPRQRCRRDTGAGSRLPASRPGLGASQWRCGGRLPPPSRLAQPAEAMALRGAAVSAGQWPRGRSLISHLHHRRLTLMVSARREVKGDHKCWS